MPTDGTSETPRSSFRIPTPYREKLEAGVKSGKFSSKTEMILHGIDLARKEIEVAE
jgi:Arc/MetJ-type ribon-helix-helix transcriptional regulator